MTLLIGALEALENSYRAAMTEAMALAEKLLAPAGPFPRAALTRLLVRARRNGAWSKLTREQQALLLAAVATPKKIYKSPALVAALRRAWLQVELATARGRAILAALIRLLTQRETRAHVTLSSLEPNSLLVLGLQLLNNPLLAM